MPLITKAYAIMNSRLLPLWIFVIIGFAACNQPHATEATTAGSNSGKIAYVDIDTLMAKYQLAVDLNEEFTKKQENMTADLNVKVKKVEDMIKSFQYRLQNNGFASRERAEKEQRQIERKRQELVELDQTLKKELAEDYQGMIKRLQDTVSNSLETFNKKFNYDLILRTTKGGNVLFGKPELDITEEFVKQLNEAYTSTDAIVKDTEKETVKEEKAESKK